MLLGQRWAHNIPGSTFQYHHHLFHVMIHRTSSVMEARVARTCIHTRFLAIPVELLPPYLSRVRRVHIEPDLRSLS